MEWSRARDHRGGTQARLTQPGSKEGKRREPRGRGGGQGQTFWAVFTLKIQVTNETQDACILHLCFCLFVLFFFKDVNKSKAWKDS